MPNVAAFRCALACLIFGCFYLCVVPARSPAEDVCSPRTPCHLFERADVIFVGSTTGSQQVRPPWSSPGRAADVSRAAFQVEEVFKGDPPAEIEILSGLYEPFPLGRFVVYARRDKTTGALIAIDCGRGHVKNHQDVIAQLREIRDVPLGRLLVTGAVEQRASWDEKPSFEPSAGVAVRLAHRRRPSRQPPLIWDFETRTDASGRYALVVTPEKRGWIEGEALLPGHHSVNLSARYFAVIDPERPRACAEVSFRLEPKQGLKVKLASWPPGASRLTLVPAESKSSARTRNLNRPPFGSTEWEVRTVPPGRYYLQAAGWAEPEWEALYPATYYPGVTDKTDAEVLIFEERADRQLVWSSRPPRRLVLMRLILGLVVDSEGRPVPDATVNGWARDGETGVDYGWYEAVTTDSHGRFQINSVVGLESRIFSEMPDSELRIKSQEIRLDAEAPTSGYVLKLPRPIDPPGADDRTR